MTVKLINDRDDSALMCRLEDRYFNQPTSKPEIFEYIHRKVNQYWNMDIRFTLIYKHEWNETDIFFDPSK